MDDTGLDPNRADLEVILQTGLEIGVLVHLAGGYTARTRAAMRRVALALGAERVEPAVTSATVGLTVHRGGWSRTAMRSAGQMGVNFTQLTELSQLSKRASSMTADEVRRGLASIKKEAKRYSPWLVVPMLGLSCAAFSMIFGADAGGAVLAGLGGAAGAALRTVMIGRRFKPFVFCLFSAFLSAAVVLILREHTGTLDEALAACVLYLVPGVPMLNGTADLLTAYYLNGVVRLTMSTVIVLGGAIGLAMAMIIWGVT